MIALLQLLAFELHLQLRHPTALALTLASPLLLGPALLVGTLWSSTATSLGDVTDLPILAPAEFSSWVGEADGLEVRGDGPLAKRRRKHPSAVWAAVELQRDGASEGVVRVRYDPALVEAHRAVASIRQVVEARSVAERRRTMATAGLDVSLDWHVEEVEIPQERPSGALLGQLLALMVPLVGLVCLTASLDTVTGEKERSTAETLLTTGLSRRTIATGKLLLVAALGLASAGVGTIGIWGFGALGGLSNPLVLGGRADAALTPAVLVGLFLGGAVTSALMAPLGTLLASWLDDYRSGTAASLSLLMLLSALASVGLFDRELDPVLTLVPITSCVLAAKEWVAGTLTWPLGAATGGFAALQIGGLVAMVQKRLAGEHAFDRGAGTASRRALGRHGQDAAGTFVVVLLLLYFFASPLQGLDVTSGALFTMVGVFGGSAIAAVRFAGAPWRLLRLTRPRLTDVGLAVVVGCCTAVLAGALILLQEQVLPMGTFGQEMIRIFELESRSVVGILFLFALLPGVFEELLCRGALMGMLDEELHPVPRVIVVAGMFAAFHLSIYRFLPTFAMGLVLGFLVLRSGSLWCGVVTHAVHNGISFQLIAREELGWGAGWGAGWLPLTAGAAVLAAGALAAVGWRATPHHGDRLDEGRVTSA